jgi:rubrerythrin
MKKFESVDEILDFAIEEEQKAHDFYMDLATRVTQPWMREAFRDFAREELGHKAKLQAVKSGKKLAPAETKVLDLKLAEVLVDVEPHDGMGYAEALIVAMKKEKAAFRLYSGLAAATDDADLRAVLRSLAAEEANHKLRFETEYDEVVLAEA